MSKIFLVIFLSLLSIGGSTQNYVDLISIDFATTPSNSFDSSSSSTVLNEVNSNITVPLPITDSFAILTGIIYEMTSASFDPERNRESITGLTIKLGVNIKHNSKWSGTYILLPKISSDFKNINERDFQIGGAVLMKYEKSNHLNYKFGLYTNSELFGPFLVPMLGFYYLSSSDKFEVKALLPLAADINYSISEAIRIGVTFKGQVRTYNLNAAISQETNRYVARATNDVYAYIQHGMKNGINVQLGLGRSVGRSYRIYDEKVSFGMPLVYFGDDRTQRNSDFADSWLFKIAAFYRFDLSPK